MSLKATYTTFTLATIFLFGLFFRASPSYATHCNGTATGHSGGNTFPCPATPTPTPSPTSLKNPLKVNSIEELLVALLTVVQVIAIPIIVFFIIYAGFLYVTARGNVEQTQKATRALMYAIIGGVIIVGAVVLSEIIKNLVTSFTP